MTDSPQKVRPLTPPEIRELLRIADAADANARHYSKPLRQLMSKSAPQEPDLHNLPSVTGNIALLRSVLDCSALRATLERYAELAEAFGEYAVTAEDDSDIDDQVEQ